MQARHTMVRCCGACISIICVSKHGSVGDTTVPYSCVAQGYLVNGRVQVSEHGA